MKIVNRTPTNLHIEMSGPIGETTALFTVPMAGLKEIVLNMDQVTFINSIGIKHWITWNLKIPADCVVRMQNCPFVIATQASIVVGFTKSNMKIESMKVPYVCDKCNLEKLHLGTVGKDYVYAEAGQEAKVLFPDELPCPKCNSQMEQDFIIEKTFKFLSAT